MLNPKVRPKAARLWRSVEAHSEEEGKDHQEVGAQDGVLRLQVEEPGEMRNEKCVKHYQTFFRCPSKGPNTSSWEERRRGRDR